MQVVTCPYCEGNCELVSGNVIYPDRPDLVALNFWRCPNVGCDAYVGCHKRDNYIFLDGKKIYSDGTLPFGTPANAQLRAVRQSVHRAFDPLWKGGRLGRRQAYMMLAQKMNRHIDATHIAMFSLDDCVKALQAVENIQKKMVSASLKDLAEKYNVKVA